MNNKFVKMLTLIILLLLIVSFVPGCGESDNGEADDKLIIGVSLPDVRGPFFTALTYGILSKAEELDVEIILLDAGGYENIDKQISQLEDLLAQGVDGILLDPADDKAISPIVNEARQLGIPVVGSGSPIDNEKVACSVTVDHTELGREMARYLAEALDGEGDIVVLAGPSGALWTENRYSGFQEVLSDYPGIRILATQWCAPDRAEGLSLAEDLIGRFPNLKGMYAADDSIGQGAGDALLAAGKTEQVELVTAILGPDTEAMIREEVIDASVAQKTVLIGAKALETLLEVIDGKQVEKEINIPTVTVTKENVDNININELRQPPGWSPR